MFCKVTVGKQTSKQTLSSICFHRISYPVCCKLVALVSRCYAIDLRHLNGESGRHREAKPSSGQRCILFVDVFTLPFPATNSTQIRTSN